MSYDTLSTFQSLCLYSSMPPVKRDFFPSRRRKVLAHRGLFKCRDVPQIQYGLYSINHFQATVVGNWPCINKPGLD